MNNSSTKQRVSDELETRYKFLNSGYVLEEFLAEASTLSSAHASESIATREFYEESTTTFISNCYRQSVVFGYATPDCMISSILGRNCGSICGHFGETFLKQFDDTLNNILLPPKFLRMTHEQRETKSEDTTKKHEVSVRNKMVCTALTKECDRKNKREHFCVTQNTHQNSNVTNSAFVPVRCKINSDTLKNGLFNRFEVRCQKRKLQSPNSENLDSGLNFNDSAEKRFKSEEPQSVYKRKGLLNKLNEPFYYGEKPIYYHPSFMQNTYSTLSGLNGFCQDKVSRKLDSNFDAFSNGDISKHFDMFGFNSKDASTEIIEKEMKTSKAQTNPAVEFRNDSIRVGEVDLAPHDECINESLSKNSEGTSVEIESKKHEKKSMSNSQKLISLDSTKSSFLTMIKKLRHSPENDAIPCPFCSQTFSKYPDLKIHVQTHKYGNTCSNENRTDQRSLYKDQLSSGNVMSTPVSSLAVYSPRPPCRRPSYVEDGRKRVTSVIQFAEKKTKDLRNEHK